MNVQPLQGAYLLAFTVAALLCFASLRRARQIDDPDTRRGFVALLAISGGWATSHVAYLLAPTPTLQYAAYVVGLVVGLAAVGPWLYICSAYTGRSLHHNSTYQRLTLGVFLGITLLKVTNPLHGVYFSATQVTTPFPHLAVQHGALHWLVMGLAYALALVGYFMLLELFEQVSADTRPLAGLAALTALPLLFDLAGFVWPWALEITHEPLGVAVFAVGILYVYLDRFEAIQVAANADDAVIGLSETDHIREVNPAARELFPQLDRDDVLGEPLWSTLPEVADAREAEPSVLSVDRGGGTRYYEVTETPFTAGRVDLGRILTITDITERERYRRELERQNDRLEQFASMVSHDLRNPLNVASGHLDIARETQGSESLEEAAVALDRMEALIEDLLALARQGQPLDEMEPIALAEVVSQSWQMVESGEATLSVESGGQIMADPDRLQQLLENLFRNAIEHGGSEVTVRVGHLDEESGFYVEDDGPGIPADARADVFESGYSTTADGTGFGLSIVAEIVDAHGWSMTVTESAEGGARFEITGVELGSPQDA